MKYKIIVLDLDGTLTNSNKEITPKTKEGLMDIQKKGYKVVLASGRPTPGVVGLAKELELEKYNGYILSYNGARIIDCNTGNVIYQKTVPNEVIPDLYETAKKHDVRIISYDIDYDTGEIVSGNGIDKYIELESSINNLPIKEVDNFGEYITFPVNKCLMSGDHEKLVKAMEDLQKKYKSYLSIYFSEPFFLEIMPQNVDKAQSLLMLLSQIGISSNEMICCGDGFNDISMIEIAGLGVAMENAQELVKDAADYVTLSNDNDGILHVINKFME
jgi:Cof subfamily protein (haloacid dehalogenase superfamily)